MFLLREITSSSIPNSFGSFVMYLYLFLQYYDNIYCLLWPNKTQISLVYLSWASKYVAEDNLTISVK